MPRLRRDSAGSTSSSSFRLSNGFSSSTTATDLPFPFGPIGVSLSNSDLQQTAYEILVAASRTTASKPLSYTPQTDRSISLSPSSLSPSLQRSLTSAAASKMKKALGLKKSSSGSGSAGKESSPSSRPKKPSTVGELMRVQMGISELMDSRIRKGLLRIAAGNLGKRLESMVLPLELLQQFKSSDFTDQQEYEAWQSRNLKVLEAGLLLHPSQPLDKSDTAAQRLRQIIRSTSDRPLDTGRNSESMQVLRSAVMSLAGRSFDGYSSDACHWADGFPLNLHLYQMLLEACFDSNSEEGSIIDEIDEVMELIKKTWMVLGINQVFHNLCFTWILFHKFVTTGQVDIDLLLAADNQLCEVMKDAKSTKDPVYLKVLSSTLSSMMGWSEKRLLAYHDTFSSSNIEFMHCIVSLGVSAARILVEDISNEYRRKRREETDVARSRVDTYIRSSLRTAFAQRMEQADLSRRSSKNHINPMLCILAKDIGDLAKKEKELFSPILKKWHPLAAGVAVATLHSCYGNELKQFVSGIVELTPDTVQVLKSADKLEKDLVHIAVEDSVDSEDGGKSLIREMPPYEAESAIANLVKAWIKSRVDKLKEQADDNLQRETWSVGTNTDKCASSATKVLELVDDTLNAYFKLPIPMHPALLPDLLIGLDRCLQHYASKVKSGLGTRSSFVPPLPALTRCEVGSKFWKKDKSQNLPKRKSQVSSNNGSSSLGLLELCVRMNSLHTIRKELDNLEKKIVTCLRNVESAQADVADGLEINFEHSSAACQDGIQLLCETTAYKVIFNDLSHVLLDALYVGEPASSRITPFLKELELVLETISSTAHDKVCNRAITALMKASFDGFLLVLLAGGPHRAFTLQDSQIIEDDFKALRDLFSADGDGLPDELIDKAAIQVKSVLPLFRSDTGSLIERFKRIVTEGQSSAARYRLPLPPTSGHWSPNEANTILRVLCYRCDEAATKFLKKTYNLPKKL